MPRGHKQVTLTFPGKRPTEVDEGIAPFLLQLWRAGYRTTQSCEENQPGLARIWFREGKQRFLDLYPEAADQGSSAVDFPMHLIHEPLRRDA